MNARRNLLMLAALVVSLLAGPALAWDEPKLKAEVQALLDQAALGFTKKDVQALAATGTDETVIKYRDGRVMDMAKWREGVAKEFADWQDVDSTFSVEKVWPMGKDQAGVIYSELHEFTRASDPGHKHAIKGRFRAVLTKTAQGWRFLEFNELSIQITRDGHPLKPKAAPQKPAKAEKPLELR